MAWLEIKNLKAFYHAIRVLHGVNLELKRNDFISVIGSNGAGKTTLLRSISRLVSSEGYVRFDGNDIIRLRPRDVIKRGIIHCPEGRLLFPNMTVYQNLMMGAFLQRDRQTIAIGGLRTHDNTESIRKVPILGDIPILGIPFRNLNQGRDKRELIIFITPSIISGGISSPEAGLLKQADRAVTAE